MLAGFSAFVAPEKWHSHVVKRGFQSPVNENYHAKNVGKKITSGQRAQRNGNEALPCKWILRTYKTGDA